MVSRAAACGACLMPLQPLRGKWIAFAIEHEPRLAQTWDPTLAALVAHSAIVHDELADYPQLIQ